MKNHDRDMTAREVAELLPKDWQPVVLEIGAHDGSTTEEILAACPRCKMICYEPDPRPFLRLREKFPPWHPRVTTRNWAIGNVNGVVKWHASHGAVGHSQDWDYSGSIKMPTHHLERSPEITFVGNEVRCCRLDDALVGQVDLAWIDVQGAQREVIAGGRKTLDETALIYIELHTVPEYDGEPTFSELCALLPAHDPVARYGENILYKIKTSLW